jgi:peptidoglycan hydrolase-like protein with peptidoglycan-binding domain
MRNIFEVSDSEKNRIRQLHESSKSLYGTSLINEEDAVTLKKGSRGDEVEVFQQELVNRKYSLPRHGVDGKFGPETEAAVKSFQKDHGLTVDGVVTQEVLTAMKDDKNVNPNPSSSNTPSGPSAKSNETASISDDLIIEIINGTISAGGSKSYTDLFLDSQDDTAVGILHFTKRGLKKLYKAMDTKTYFGKSQDEMIDSIKTYSGDEMKDASWKKGMLKFLHSSESESVQNKAATRKFKDGLAIPIQKGGWTTPREYAVGMFYLNSYPKCLGQMGTKYNWDAEKMLKAYCSGECSAVSACRSRCNHINKSYPISASAGGYVYKGC